MKIGEICGGSANKCRSLDNRHPVDSAIQQVWISILESAEQMRSGPKSTNVERRDSNQYLLTRLFGANLLQTWGQDRGLSITSRPTWTPGHYHPKNLNYFILRQILDSMTN